MSKKTNFAMETYHYLCDGEFSAARCKDAFSALILYVREHENSKEYTESAEGLFTGMAQSSAAFAIERRKEEVKKLPEGPYRALRLGEIFIGMATTMIEELENPTAISFAANHFFAKVLFNIINPNDPMSSDEVMDTLFEQVRETYHEIEKKRSKQKTH